jgi:hypothetical protein
MNGELFVVGCQKRRKRLFSGKYNNGVAGYARHTVVRLYYL